jgi:signal transduction histidine kinase
MSLVFEAYTRLRHPHSVTGLGLGLFVSREIVVAHGGSITATSRLRDGTTIAVRLPVARDATKAPARTTAKPVGARRKRADPEPRT